MLAKWGQRRAALKPASLASDGVHAWSHCATGLGWESAAGLLDTLAQLMVTSDMHLDVQAWTVRWRSASLTRLSSWRARIAL